MKSCHYDVYVHLDQCDGEVRFAKCNCKAGQGGCCKHVAALLYTLLDFTNVDTKEVPKDLTCTQVGQRWNVPSTSTQGAKVFKFNNLLTPSGHALKTGQQGLQPLSLAAFGVIFGIQEI